MSQQSQRLPAAFADWEIFLNDWEKLETPEERYILRQNSRLVDLQRFYDSVAPRIEEALDHLEQYPVNSTLPPQEEALFKLALALTEVAAAIEIYNQPTVPFVPKPHVVHTDWSDGTR
jgi:hypothetical protein